MDKINSLVEKILLPFSAWVNNNKSLQAISKGFMSILPVTIISSLFYLIANFPISAWTNWLASNGLDRFVLIPYNVTMSLFAIYAAFSIGYAYAANDNEDGLSSGILSLINFLIVTPYIIDEAGELSYGFGWLGCKGLFVAMIVAVITAKVFVLFQKKGWVIKMPDGVPPFVGKSFASLIPGFLLALVFMFVAIIFAKTSFGSIHQLIYTYLQIPLTNIGGSLPGYLFMQVFIQFLWWFGIHGFNVCAGIFMPIYLSIDAARLAGETTNPIGMSLMTVVGQSTVAVCLVMLLFCKSRQLKEIGKVAMPAAVFNIGEPVVFGVPNVLNPYMFLPSVVIVPLVTNLFFYLGFVSGIVTPLSGAQVSMQVPVVLYGLVQGNWMVALWQLIAIPLAMVLYLPFYKMYDKKLLAEEQEREAANA